MTQILPGDCREVLQGLAANSIASCITDPPYGLSKEPDIAALLAAWLAGEPYIPPHRGGGFMNAAWDAMIPGPEYWREVYRVLKPGAFLVCFAGTRTEDLLGISLRLAGFRRVDTLMWIAGSGFPKSLNVSQVAKNGGIACACEGSTPAGPQSCPQPPPQPRTLADERQPQSGGAWPYCERCGKPIIPTGIGTALKPAHEPIILAQKPIAEKSIAANLAKWGVGGLNIAATRIEGASTMRSNRAELGYHGGNLATEYTTGSAQGRWPANVILGCACAGETHDPDCAVALLDQQSGERPTGKPTVGSRDSGEYWRAGGGGYATKGRSLVGGGDTGGASRFFATFDFSHEDLLFSRAKAILEAWNCDLATTADDHSSLSNGAVGSALNRAAIAASLGARRLSALTVHGTTITPTKLRQLCESVIGLILSSESAFLPETQHVRHTPPRSLANGAASPKPTDTTTITTARLTSDGCAVDVTLEAMPTNSVHGAADSPTRFKYCAKSSRAERDAGLDALPLVTPAAITASAAGSARRDSPRTGAGRTSGGRNTHPTVKPQKLLSWLCRLVTPPGGTILDPFAGSGSTGVAAVMEGCTFIGIERETAYLEIIRARLAWAERERARQTQQCVLPLDVPA